MAKVKLVWRVSPAPSGRYSSFQSRAFPSANYKNGEPAAQLICSESYQSFHKDATGLEIVIMVALWENDTFNWRKLKRSARSIAEAKERVEAFFNDEKYVDIIHPDYREAV